MYVDEEQIFLVMPVANSCLANKLKIFNEFYIMNLHIVFSCMRIFFLILKTSKSAQIIYIYIYSLLSNCFIASRQLY